MLTYLSVSDFALIESAQVEFERGFNVFTGETGSGKTVFLGAINVLLGDRAEILKVRAGADAAKLAAVFDLAGNPELVEWLREADLMGDDETELVINRTIRNDGRSRAMINGVVSPVATLARVGERLVEVHGQNTHQALLRSSTHMEYLDRFAGAAHLAELTEYENLYRAFRSLLDERDQLTGNGEDLSDEEERLSAELERIDALSIIPGELEELEQKEKRMRHFRELMEGSARIEEGLGADDTGRGALDIIQSLLGEARSMASRDEGLGPLLERLESLFIDGQDILSEFVEYRQSLDIEPDQLNETVERIGAIRELCRVHGGTLGHLFEKRKEFATRLDEITRLTERANIIDVEIEERFVQLTNAAERLTSNRREAAARFAEAVNLQFGELELSTSGFEVLVAQFPEAATPEEAFSRPGPTGQDTVEFLFSPQLKLKPLPLKKIASGGEISRVMLAIKVVLAGVDRLPVLIFDEADSGIGGETAASLGRKLAGLSGYHQVFCITHLPQVAAYADSQYRVEKRAVEGAEKTVISALDEENRIDEICRMLGDSSGRTVTRAHALDIIGRARNHKER